MRPRKGRRHRGDARGADTVAMRVEPTPWQRTGSRHRSSADVSGGEDRSGRNAAVRRKGREAGDAGGRLAGVQRARGLGRMRMEGQ